MSVVSAPNPDPRTRSIRDLLRQLGDVPPERVLLDPLPGTATEVDAIALEARESRLCELVDGTLVEKAMGFRESVLTVFLARLLSEFVERNDLGVVAGPDGMMRLFPGTIRIPDIAFVSWQRLPGRRIPSEPAPDLVPDLAVEVVSRSNTASELARKCREYFTAGVKLVWIINPDLRRVSSYQSADRGQELGESEKLTGGPVLPGFEIVLADLFARMPESR